MPESIIKKVKQSSKSNAQPNTLKFSDKNRILFEWNNKVNKYSKGLVNKDVVLYPPFAAEIPGVVLKRDLPIPPIEDKFEPQGRAKDAVACNATLEPFYVTGVDAPTIILANNDEINEIDDDKDDILLIATIPENNNLNPLIPPDTSDSETLNNKDQNEDMENDNNNLSNNNSLKGDGQGADKLEEGSTEDQDQGVNSEEEQY
jgi:hypothetical protein